MTMSPDTTGRVTESLDGDVAGTAEPTGQASVKFRLYLCVPTPSSARARANLDAIVAGLGERARNLTIETIDVAADPLMALKDRVIVTPTLMLCGRAQALPPIVGDFSDTGLVRAYLEAALNDAPTQARDR
jgi:hypothetical protein